jgi:hypothetical protein
MATFSFKYPDGCLRAIDFTARRSRGQQHKLIAPKQQTSSISPKSSFDVEENFEPFNKSHGRSRFFYYLQRLGTSYICGFSSSPRESSDLCIFSSPAKSYWFIDEFFRHEQCLPYQRNYTVNVSLSYSSS